jgi:hypothetical protein
MLKLMAEQLEFVKFVAGSLDLARVPYMLTGSVAMALYAEPRMTRDLDLVIECPPRAVDELIRLLEPSCYLDADAVHRAFETYGMFNIIHRQLVIKADFIVRKDDPYRRMEFSRRREDVIDGVRIWVVAPEDLILSKLVWSKESRSARQLSDVRLLLGAVANLDNEYLDRWAAHHGVHAWLAEARAT